MPTNEEIAELINDLRHDHAVACREWGVQDAGDITTAASLAADALEALAAEREWRPIETAPADNTLFFWLDWADDCVGLNPPIGEEYSRWFFGKRNCWSSLYKATHWREPPPPPSEWQKP